jgi:hypothetical protein
MIGRQKLTRTFTRREERCWPVSPLAGNVKNNDPSLIGCLIEPVAVNIGATAGLLPLGLVYSEGGDFLSQVLSGRTGAPR